MENITTAQQFLINLAISFIGPSIVLIVANFLGRNKNKGDYAITLQNIAENAIEEQKKATIDLQQEKERSKQLDVENREKLKKIQEDMSKLQREIDGPYLVTAELVTRPNPSIISFNIELKKSDDAAQA